MKRLLSGLVVAVFLLVIPQALVADDKPAKRVPVKPPVVPIKWEIKQLSDNLNEGIAVFDVNKDGVLDVTAGPSWFEGPSFKQHPLREVRVDNKEFMTNNGEHGIDLDGDGWTDVLTASWFSDKVMWFRNPGKDGLAAGKLWEGREVVGGQPCCEGTVLEDIDRDGTPELTINKWDGKLPATIVRITLGKNGGEPKFQAVELGQGYGHGVAVGDVNGDKLADVVTAEGWYEQPASKWYEAKWAFHKAPGKGHSSLPGLVVDVNGDGRNDLVTAHAHDYGMWWFEQGPAKDGQPTWTEHEVDHNVSQLHYMMWTDLDGDGTKELITGKRWRGHGDGDPGSADPVCLLLYRWDKAAKTLKGETLSWDEKIGTGMQVRVVDLDKDGKQDIAVAGKTGTFVMLNRGKK